MVSCLSSFSTEIFQWKTTISEQSNSIQYYERLEYFLQYTESGNGMRVHCNGLNKRMEFIRIRRFTSHFKMPRPTQWKWYLLRIAIRTFKLCGFHLSIHLFMFAITTNAREKMCTRYYYKTMCDGVSFFLIFYLTNIYSCCLFIIPLSVDIVQLQLGLIDG